jgi:hypothetical protein
MSHGIFGWDLPPGVSINDIPGNRPEDERWDAIYDNFWDKERLLKQPTDITKEQVAKMEKIWLSNSKLNRELVGLIDAYIMNAIEYGMDISEQETRQNDKLNKSCDRIAVEQAFEDSKTIEEAHKKVVEYLCLGKY